MCVFLWYHKVFSNICEHILVLEEFWIRAGELIENSRRSFLQFGLSALHRCDRSSRINCFAAAVFILIAVKIFWARRAPSERLCGFRHTSVFASLRSVCVCLFGRRAEKLPETKLILRPRGALRRLYLHINEKLLCTWTDDNCSVL